MPQQGFSKHPAERLSARAEAAGLEWLRQASSAVVEVLEVSDDHLVTAEVAPGRADPGAAREAGRELARIHAAGAPAFGSPPPGWEGPNYIGTQEQACRPTDDWADFYVNQRVMPFARQAHRRGNLTAGELSGVEAACEAILAADLPAVSPARLHGDLWAGNLLFGVDGPAFIDPAAHGGHRETDLAMLALFGAPHLEEIYAGYQEVTPLPEGWRENIPMHQLHPLAVHAVTHGPSYGAGLAEAAVRTLSVLE